MSKNPSRYYSKLPADWSPQSQFTKYLSKYFPLSEKITAENFEDFAKTIGDLALDVGRSTRGEKQTTGGGIYEDVRTALSCASQIAIAADFYAESARNFKHGSVGKLRRAWASNDAETLLYLLTGYERNASDTVLDHADCDGIGYDPIEFYEMDDESEEPEQSEEMLAMADELIMFKSEIQKKIYGGNWTKNREKLSSKPAKRENKQLTLSLWGVEV